MSYGNSELITKKCKHTKVDKKNLRNIPNAGMREGVTNKAKMSQCQYVPNGLRYLDKSFMIIIKNVCRRRNT